MSDITITSKNLSRFSKRLQKALQSELGMEISLHQSALLFAKALGTDTLHHLQKKLEETASISKQSTENDYANTLIRFIEEFIKSTPNTKISGISVLNSFGDVSITISAQNSFPPSTSISSIGGIGIYFGQDSQYSQYISKEIPKLLLDPEDIKFIEGLTRLMHTQDVSLSSFIGARLSEKLKLNEKKESFYRFDMGTNDLTPQHETIANYGFCQKFIVSVEADFFERIGAPFVLDNDKYSFIDLSKEKELKFFNTIEEALESKNELLIEFLTPINQVPLGVRKSIYKKQGICSYYIFKNSNKMIASTVNAEVREELNSIESFYNFLGKKYFRESKSLSSLLGALPINHTYKSYIESGFNQLAQQSKLV